jgi:DNA-directed RNA polymerase specialized sigma24 family protein
MDSQSHSRVRIWWQDLPLSCQAEFQACLRRICAWQIPPNWCRPEWVEEISAVAAEAACEAELQFDPSYGMPVHAFVHSRVLGRSLSRYRREWAFARRCVGKVEGDADGIISGRELLSCAATGYHNPACDALMEAVAQLSDPHRRLIEELFWQERTEAEIGCELGISQRAVSKRKQVALRSLEGSLKPVDRNQKSDGQGSKSRCSPQSLS